MSNNLGIFCAIYVSALLCFSGDAAADIYNQNAFLYGHNIEVGLGRDGAFGSDINSPDIGRKSYGNNLGYISDPTGNRFQASYHGDFFLPGIPEEGWGVSFDGKKYNNNSNQQGAEILGSLSNFKSTTHSQKVSWKGTIEGLEITQVYRIYTVGTAIVFDVTLKNTTDTVMNDVYYMRTVDPDNNAEQDPGIQASKYATTNTILSQGSDGSGISAVSAMQNAKAGLFTQSLLTLSGYGANSRVAYGGAFNRNPVDVYNGTGLLQQTGTNTADEAISLAFKFDQLEAGDTVTFRAGYQLKEVPIPVIDIDDDNSGESGNGYKQLYILGSSASNITDTDVSITGSGFTQLQQAIITLTNPHNGDLLEVSGTLPAGISINTTESTNTEIRLTGLVAKEDYQTALKQIVFSNSDTHSRIDTRIVTIQLIDENATPSNAALSIIGITTPVVLDNPKIADDDVVNGTEASAVAFSGHAAPDASLIIDFTDKNGDKLTPAKTMTADENGNWSLDTDPADLSSLSDGLITILIKATDSNGNISTLTREIIKDTIIILSDIMPINDQVVSSSTPTYTGKSDVNASITLKILPDGKLYTTTADANGDWSILLDRFPMGVTTSVRITAEDEYANQTSSTFSFITPNLPIEIIDMDVDSQGMAHSTTPTIKGTSNPETTISIEMPTTNGQSTSCNTTTDSDGNWTCKLPVSPAGGPYTLTVTTTDRNGNTNSTSRQISIPALSLVVDTPTENQLVSTTKPTFDGTTDPNATVELKVLPNGKTYTTTADAQGNWSIPLDEALPKGKNVSVEVKTTDEAGNESTVTRSIQTPTLPIDITSTDSNAQGVALSMTPTLKGTSEPNTSISINMPTTNGQSISCNTTTDTNGNWVCQLPVSPSGGSYTVTATTTDSEGNTNTSSVQLSIPDLPLIIDNPINDAVISGVKPVISGTSKPGTNVVVSASNGDSCTAVTDDTNHWSCQLTSLAFDQNYTLTVTTTDSIGNSTTKAVNISTDKLPLSVITPQNNSTTEDTTPTFIGTTTPGTVVTVTLPTGQECTATANDEGRWSCELPAVPVGGPYTATIKAVDTHGNQTTFSEIISIPAIPLIINSPVDNEMIEANDVTVTGNSDPNTPIKVLGPDGESCETTSDANGAWSCLLENLQSGLGKHVTVISGGEGNSKKVAITSIDIKNSSEKVKTILAGSSPLSGLFFLGFILLLKFYQKRIRK